jgi:uncharacterized damage-inducible protein DinB
MPFGQTLLPEFDEEMKSTRKMLECVPDGKFEYQPHKKSMTLGQLATHVALLPAWTTTLLDQEVLDLSPDFKPELVSSHAELLEKFDSGVAAARAKLNAATDQDWQKAWTFKFAGMTMFSNPRTVVMRGVILNHLIHHRAQLGVYLRLMDVAIPGMYGPSADEANFMKAQTASGS